MEAATTKKKGSYSDDEAIEKTFNFMDQDKDGKLTVDEIIKGLKQLGLPNQKNNVLELLKRADTDSSGSITLEEFKDYINHRHSELRILFDKIDKNKDGTIGLDEIQESLKELNIETDGVVMKKLMRTIDKDMSDSISFEEWEELLVLAPQLELEYLYNYWQEAAALWIDTEVPNQKKEDTNAKQLLSMLCGAASGVVSKTSTAPLERLKVIYQVQTNPPPMITVLRNIWMESGWRGFFRSNGANLLKIAPEMAIKFGIYEKMKSLFAENEEDVTHAQTFFAGGVSGVAAHTCVFPLDVIKTRMAIATGPRAGIMSTARAMSSDGYFRPFFKGWIPMVISTMPSSALSIGLFSSFKMILEARAKDGVLNTSTIAACSTISGIITAIVTYPLGVIKSRLQVQGVAGHTKEFTGAIDVVRKTFAREGVSGFYRGLAATMLKHVPSQTIGFVSYDLFRKQLGLESKKKKHK